MFLRKVPFAVCAAILLANNGFCLADDTNPSAEDRAAEKLQKLGATIQRDPRGQVYWVHLEKCRVTDDDLACLADLPHLRRLYLADTEIGDRGLAAVAGLPNLERVSLWKTKVTDAGMAHLARSTNLRVLDLHHTRVGDAGLKRLAGLTRLEKLSVGGVTGAGLAHLQGMTELEELGLRGSITDADLARLAPLKSLRVLNLCDTDVEGRGLEHLKGLANLEFVHLENVSLTDQQKALLPNVTIKIKYWD